jgi:hypothetical protein
MQGWHQLAQKFTISGDELVSIIFTRSSIFTFLTSCEKDTEVYNTNTARNNILFIR